MVAAPVLDGRLFALLVGAVLEPERRRVRPLLVEDPPLVALAGVGPRVVPVRPGVVEAEHRVAVPARHARRIEREQWCCQ